jgi:hypothetical protein
VNATSPEHRERSSRQCCGCKIPLTNIDIPPFCDKCRAGLALSAGVAAYDAMLCRERTRARAAPAMLSSKTLARTAWGMSAAFKAKP